MNKPSMEAWATAREHRDVSGQVLCVDLDGTLIHSDLLIESALLLLGRNPLYGLLMAWWLLKEGKAHLKRQIASRVTMNPALLPYNRELLEWLHQQPAEDRHTVLCTASDLGLAESVARHVGVFDEVIASDGSRNVAGIDKAAILVERFGERGFDYVGNAPVDLAVWRHARSALVVESSERLSRAAAKLTTVQKRFETPPAGLRTWLKALRVHQWVKNVLVFLPILAAHRILEVQAFTHTLLAFVCFGLCASSVYLANDLLDLPSDRQHTRKRRRPFAAGALPLIGGPVVSLALLATGFTLAWFGNGSSFTLVLAGYFTLTTAYSFHLKRIVMVDVVVLAMLYTTRIVAGAAAIATRPSFWLLAFSMFIFLSLAMIKRYTELMDLQRRDIESTSGRGYAVDDLSMVQSLGAASGYLAVLVLALYIDSDASSALYRHPHYLWMLCPLLLYWVSRTWIIAHRGRMHDDPVVFALKDHVSRILLVLAAFIVLLAL